MEDVFGVCQHIRRTDPAQVKLVLTIETKDVVKDVVKEVPDFVKDFVKEIPEEVQRQLSDRQIEILALIAIDSTISAKAISEKISEKASEKDSITDRTIQNDIAKLKKLGILSRTGGRKNGEWEMLYNPNFNCTEFDTIRNAAGSNSFVFT